MVVIAVIFILICIFYIRWNPNIDYVELIKLFADTFSIWSQYCVAVVAEIWWQIMPYQIFPISQVFYKYRLQLSNRSIYTNEVAFWKSPLCSDYFITTVLIVNDDAYSIVGHKTYRNLIWKRPGYVPFGSKSAHIGQICG